MMRPDDLVGYSYRADIFCGHCLLIKLNDDGFPFTLHIEARALVITVEGLHDIGVEQLLYRLAVIRHYDRNRESSFDSGEFPKVIFRDQAHDCLTDTDDGDVRCAACGANLAQAPKIPPAP